MGNAYAVMGLDATGGFRSEDIFFFLLGVVVAAGVSLAVFAACLHWFRGEQGSVPNRKVSESGLDPDQLFLTSRDAALHGELVAQFKVNHGKQVVSLLESDGKRFLHVDGKLSAPERAKMVRYLKSEGFMS
jgi:hypothetical protein